MGPAVGEVAKRLGKPLMPWQQHAIDVILEIDPVSWELVYTEFGLTVPRQSGKSILLLAKATHRCYATGFFGPAQQVVYTAQTRKDARKKFEVDYAAVIATSAFFKGKADPRWGNGNEHIRYPNGSRFSIEAQTETAGHGGTLDEGYIDEAFAQTDWRMELALGPAMITRRNRQFGWISTAGWSDASPYLEQKVKWGREHAQMGVREGLAYFEWSAPQDADPADTSLWPSFMPALGHTISERAVAAELAKAEATGALSAFRRSYMNLWVPKDADTPAAIPAAVWNAHRNPDSTITGGPVFAYDVSPERGMAAIAVAGAASSGSAQVEVTAQEGVGVDHRAGTDWLVPRLLSLADRHQVGTVYGTGSSAEAIRPQLEAGGLTVEILTGPDLSAACGAFYDAATNGQLVHLGQPSLDQALAAAKQSETDHGWTWARRKSGDITPLIAATVALWGHTVGRSNYDVLQSAF